nr:hypothetical protein [Tanacetum cinerariifolium]
MKSGSKTLYFYLANWKVQSLRVTLWGGLGDVLVKRKTKHVGMCAVVLTIMSANSVAPTKVVLAVDSSLAKEGTLENLLIWARNRQNNTATFHCKVMIENFKNKKGWNYPSYGYENCRKDVTRQHGKWLCEACNKIFDYPVFRYRFEVVVADDTAHIVVVMFDDTTTEFVKCSTESLMAADDEGADVNDDSNLPTTIRNLIEDTASSSTPTLIADDATSPIKILARHPTVYTPLKPNKEKKKRPELEDSDVDEVCGPADKKKKRKRYIKDDSESA